MLSWDEFDTGAELEVATPIVEAKLQAVAQKAEMRPQPLKETNQNQELLSPTKTRSSAHRKHLRH